MKSFNKAEWITAAIAIIIILTVIISIKSKLPTRAPTLGNTSVNTSINTNNMEPSNTGKTAAAGNTVYVHYVGTLQDGTKFDSSYDRGQPLAFKLGANQVIKGWDEGIVGMKVGEKKKLVIPPLKAYGAQGVQDRPGHYIIPPNATLLFDVELVDVE
jgi:FKBP-type peptidyl-prolyl cis-trans isomerase